MYRPFVAATRLLSVIAFSGGSTVSRSLATANPLFVFTAPFAGRSELKSIVSIPDLLLVKISDFLNLHKVLYNSNLPFGACIILPFNRVVRPPKSKSLNGGFLLLGSAYNAAYLRNLYFFSLMIAIQSV